MTKWEAIKFWMAGVSPQPEPVAPTAPRHMVCGVPDCEEGYLLEADAKWSVIACDAHNAHTRWENERREQREQQIIRVQDRWRQHGTSPTPGGRK